MAACSELLRIQESQQKPGDFPGAPLPQLCVSSTGTSVGLMNLEIATVYLFMCCAGDRQGPGELYTLPTFLKLSLYVAQAGFKYATHLPPSLKCCFY